MTRRNVRDRQLRRWASQAVAVDRRNGVWLSGYDPRHVGQILSWCVEAYLVRQPEFVIWRCGGPGREAATA
jgi:hypothetical protein